jgi:hypothetical protein
VIHRSTDTEYEFVPDDVGLFVNSLVHIWIENNLRNPFTVPKVHEYNTAMIPSTLYPAHEDDLTADIFCAEFATGMGSSHFSKFIRQ